MSHFDRCRVCREAEKCRTKLKSGALDVIQLWTTGNCGEFVVLEKADSSRLPTWDSSGRLLIESGRERVDPMAEALAILLALESSEFALACATDCGSYLYLAIICITLQSARHMSERGAAVLSSRKLDSLNSLDSKRSDDRPVSCVSACIRRLGCQRSKLICALSSSKNFNK